MINQCPICNSKNLDCLRSYKNKYPSFNNLNLFKCSICNLVFVNPMPTDEILAEFNSNYFESAHGGQRLDVASTAFYSGISKLRAMFLNSYINANNISANRILEIGPGPGYFAKNWITNNSDTEYFAIETDETCYNTLTSLGVKLIEKENFKNFSNSIDVVIMSHVLEHVSKPKDFINFALEFLKQGGVLFIEVPCNDWEHKEIDEPHLLFFNKKSINLLLEVSGLFNIKTAYYGQLINRLKNKSFIKKKVLGIRTRLINLGLGKLLGNIEIGLEPVDNAIERAVLKPYCAHIESNEPAWWLRAIALKK